MDGVWKVSDMKQEKITINLGVAELGQIDFLVDKGIYSSRSDFIRIAVKSQIEHHSEEIKDYLNPEFLQDDSNNSSIRSFGGVGIIHLSKSSLDILEQADRRLAIKVMGILSIDGKITPDLIDKTINSVKVHGKIIASEEIKQALDKYMEWDWY